MVNLDFDKFKNATGYDIRSFFRDYSDFYKFQYQSIITYYSGGENNIEAFERLDDLINESRKIEPLFTLASEKLDTIDMWELMELFSDMQIKLLTTKNTGKWMRSSRLNTNSTEVQIERIQGNEETIETISDNLGYVDSQNGWSEVAINNQLEEEGYTMDGGAIITVTFKNNSTLSLPNIVDYYTGKNVLGKDIKKKIRFSNNDLEVVEYEDAIKQSFETKIEIQKNGIPKFPAYGTNPEQIGTNVSAISYPTLFRDLLALFKQDKRWSEVNLIDLNRKDDIISLKFEAKTILKDSLITNINI